MTQQSGGGGASGAAGGVLSGTYPSPAFTTNGTDALLSSHTALLAGNVAMTNANQFYDGPTCALTAGTWLVVASLMVGNPAAGNHVTLKVWDGTTVVGNGWQVLYAAGVTVQVTALGLYVATSAVTLKASAASDNAGGTIFAAVPVNGSGNVASSLTAVRIA